MNHQLYSHREMWLSKPIAELELSVRSAMSLEAAYITTIRETDILSEMGFSLGMTPGGETLATMVGLPKI